MALNATFKLFDGMLNDASSASDAAQLAVNDIQSSYALKISSANQLGTTANQYYTDVKNLVLSATALDYRAQYVKLLAQQYMDVSACFTSACEKLYNDICAYTEETAGISGLYSGILAYSTETGDSHISSDFNAHGSSIYYQPFIGNSGISCGKYTTVFPLSDCFTCPSVRYGDTMLSGATAAPVKTPVAPTIIPLVDGATVQFRIIYSSNGDAYIQYPIDPSLLTNSQLLYRTDINGTVTAWYGYDGSKSHYGGETANINLKFIRSQLNPDAGPYYLMFNVGSLTATVNGTAGITLTARSTGTWSFDAGCIVVADEQDETTRTSDTTITGSYRWTAGNTDGFVIKLPTPVSGTSDLTSTLTYYNAITVLISGTTNVPGISYYLQQ
jgi:hypothetical protein